MLIFVKRDLGPRFLRLPRPGILLIAIASVATVSLIALIVYYFTDSVEPGSSDQVVIHGSQPITILESETNTTRRWSFSISNMTHSTVELVYTDASCTCFDVVPDKLREKLSFGSKIGFSPQETVAFDVSSRVNRLRGTHTHGVEFAETDNEHVRHKVVQVIKVLPDIETTPEYVSFVGSQPAGDELAERTVKVTRRSRTPTTLHLPMRLVAAGDREIVSTVAPDGEPYQEAEFWVRSWTAVVRLRGPATDTSEQDYYSRIDVSVDGDPAISGTLPVTIANPAKIRVFPGKRVEFSTDPQGGMVTRKVLISSSDGHPFAIRSVKIQDSAFVICCELDVEKPSHIVEISHQSASQEAHAEKMVITTSSQTDPELSLLLCAGGPS